MATIKIFQDSKGPGRCRSCGAPLTWAETVAGKKIPLDGREIVVLQTIGNPIGHERIVELVDVDVNRVHFSTCPEAKEWRRR